MAESKSGRDLMMQDNLLPEHNAVRSTRHCLQRAQCTWGGLYRTEPLFVTGFYLLAPLKPAIWKEKALLTERPHIPMQNLGKARLQEGLLTLQTPAETRRRHRAEAAQEGDWVGFDLPFPFFNEGGHGCEDTWYFIGEELQEC